MSTLKKLGVLMITGGLLSACTGVSYGHRSFNPSPEYAEMMEADSRRVQNAERAERAERRRERRQEMMDEADAYRRATQGQRVYILR
ncbi:hypothetical protein L1281_002448 [Neisseria sp. HSC-16F19]|nr:hypothetical protein [Neisseria sp. HSC-16F19]MCP2041830.1 hypothetical protein [Neisseria sp. HSC-16F19]